MLTSRHCPTARIPALPRLGWADLLHHFAKDLCFLAFCHRSRLAHRLQYLLKSFELNASSMRCCDVNDDQWADPDTRQ